MRKNLFLLGILALLATPAYGQFFQTYVSVHGSNANDCDSPSNACRTLASAVANVNPGGKVFVLDSGDFDSNVTIDKSIDIQAVGVDATLFTGATTKIVVDAGPDDVVVLDGLTLRRDVPMPTGTNDGIQVDSARAVHVRNCHIIGFGRAGIFVNTADPTRVHVSDCVIEHSVNGVVARPQEGGGDLDVILDNVTVLNNSEIGVHADNARIWLSGSTISFNGTGVLAENGGTLHTLGNNLIRANDTDGVTTHKAGLQ